MQSACNQLDLFGEHLPAPVLHAVADRETSPAQTAEERPFVVTDTRIADVVDALLLTQGEVSLAACLQNLAADDDERATIDALQHAYRYAMAQGLVPQQEGDPPTALSALCAVVLRPANDAGQTDLFRHSAATVAVNALCDALVGHRIAEAQAAFDRMVELGAADRDDYRRMLDALTAPEMEPARHLEEIQATLVPLARRRLGDRARGYLRPLWLELAARIQGTTFSPCFPQLHASHAYLKAEDWPQALSSVLAETQWQEHPELVVRAAIAQARLGDRAAARRSWMLLCWQHPQAAQEQLRDAGGDRVLARHWQAFDAAELAFDTRDFPAWLLITDVHQREWVPQALAPEDAAGEAFVLLHRLLASGGAINDRRALQGAHPDLLRAYLAAQRT